MRRFPFSSALLSRSPARERRKNEAVVSPSFKLGSGLARRVEPRVPQLPLPLPSQNERNDKNDLPCLNIPPREKRLLKTNGLLQQKICATISSTQHRDGSSGKRRHFLLKGDQRLTMATISDEAVGTRLTRPSGGLYPAPSISHHPCVRSNEVISACYRLPPPPPPPGARNRTATGRLACLSVATVWACDRYFSPLMPTTEQPSRTPSDSAWPEGR